MSRTKSIGQNAILNTIKTVMSIVFPLITFPYISRVLQVEAVGVYTFSSSIVSYFVMLAGLGIATYAIREGTQYRNDKDQIEKFVSEVFSINMLATIVSYCCLFIVWVLVSKLHNYTLAIAILSIEIIFTTIGVSWVCNIFEDFLFIAIQSIAVQAVSLILIFAFVKTPEDIYKYLGIVAFSKSASCIINFIYIRKKYCHFKWILHCNLKRHIKPILIIFSTSVAMTIYVSSDATMLGFMSTDYQVGLYGTAVKIYTIVKNVLAAALVVLVPRFSLLLQGNSSEDANLLFSKVFNTLSLIIFPAMTGLFITSRDVTRLVGGEKYLGGAESLQLLCLAIAFSLIATLYTQCILIPNKKETMVFKATIVSAVVNILLNFGFIPWLGINGAAITTVISELIVCLMVVYYSKSDIHLSGILRNYISIGIGCAVIILDGLLTKQLIEIYWIRLSITVISSCILYLVVLIATKNSIAIDAINIIKNKVKKKFQ